MIKYFMSTGYIFNEAGNLKESYGVYAVDSTGSTVKSVPNVFSSKAKAQEFIAMCNSFNLSLFHLMDCIDEAFSL